MDKDPITGLPYPPDAIQRILFVTPKVHVYRIPPLTSSTKGFAASSWTQNPSDLIFTARLRVIETAIPPPPHSLPDTPEKVFVNILLEDAKTGDLFAAAPYTSPAVVEQASDSSRFFALRVVGEGGMKATLGIGYEERPEAFDFGVCLQDAKRVLGFDGAAAQTQAGTGGRRGGRAGTVMKPVVQQQEVKKDFSLKEGETITVNIGGKSRIGKTSDSLGGASAGGGSGGLFSIPPPPSGKPSGSSGSIPFLPPPPSASGISGSGKKQPSAADLGFDDGEFGEFQ